MELDEEKIRSGIAEKLTRFLIDEGVVLLPLKLNETYYYFDEEDDEDDWCEGTLRKITADALLVSKLVEDEKWVFGISYRELKDFNDLKEIYFNSKAEALADWAKYYKNRGE